MKETNNITDGSGEGANAIVNGIQLNLSAQNARRSLTRLSALIFIVLPTLLSVIYFGLIAADQYSSEVKFSIRGSEKAGGSDLLGMVTGLPSANSTVTDSYIIIEYIHSRELVEKLQQLIDLRKIFSSDKADWFVRFNPNETIEEFVEYWKWMANVQFDSSTNIIAVEIRAFTPKDAQRVAAAVLEASEKLVNELSERVRRDAVRFADQEVKHAEARVRKNRLKMLKFRDLRQEIDPVKKAESRLTLLATLNQQLVTKKTELANLKLYVKNKSPTVSVLENEISSLEKQIVLERAGPGALLNRNGYPLKLSLLLADYEEIMIDREFAEKAYVSSLASLQLARAEADRQQRYLSAFVRPKLPEEAIYPYRITNTILVFIISTILWSLGLLVVYGIRDHG